MKFEKQPNGIQVVNVEGAPAPSRHGPLLPSTIRALVIGPSNCGKTNSVLSFVTSPKGLRFENVYVFSKSLNQSKYKNLKAVLRPLKDIGYFEFSNNSTKLPPSQAKPNSIFIFDDIACEKQKPVLEYFSLGRHNGIDCFYLCQSYARIPKQLVRDNANFLIIFKQDVMNLKHVYNNHVGSDLTLQQFFNLCHACWKNPYGFLVIDLDSPKNKGRYRKGYNEFVIF